MKQVCSKVVLLVTVVLTCFNLSFAMSDGVVITGEKTIEIPLEPQDLSMECAVNNAKTKAKCLKYFSTVKTSQQTKKITVNTVYVDDSFQEKLKRKLELIKDKDNDNSNVKTNFNSKNTIKNRLHFSIDLGMSNVPVLDQGNFGTCATFATTAALDALKNAGDYISQQCLLELGMYEEKRFHAQSGWDGADYLDILNRIKKYGIVDKKSCPHDYGYNNLIMNPELYINYSFNGQWSNDFNWESLESIDHDGIVDSADLETVKQHLDNGHRVLIGSLLINDYAIGFPINNRNHGFWDLPKNYTIKQFREDMRNNKIIGHALVVVGYDDVNQVIKVRNSWGPKVGDKGDFYMSYDYFNSLNIDTIVIY